MKEVERTRQQLDPVGTLSTRILAVVLSAGALVYGVVMTIRTADQMSNLLMGALSLMFLAAASVTVGLASSPQRAPFTATTHVVVQLLALGSIALAAVSQWGTNLFIQDDFGSVSLGMLILAMGVYRPARELASVGALAAIFVGFITLLKVPSLVTDLPPVAFVLAGMGPILALSFGSAAYSGRLVKELEKWHALIAQTLATATGRLTEGITSTVRADRVKILDRDVFPFFNAVLSQDTVTRADRERARQIADSIRKLMVAEADRTWLEVVAADDGVTPEDMHRSVADAEGRATSMVAGQRTVLRALIVALHEDVALVTGTLKVTITGTENLNSGLLAARVLGTVDDPLIAFAPYFAVMRVVFDDVRVEYRDSKLTVRFSYEQR